MKKMINILDALNSNVEVAKKLLKGKGAVALCNWNDGGGEYEDVDGFDLSDVGVYVRLVDDKTESIVSQLVISVRYNENIGHIEIVTAEDEYTESDGHWFPIYWCDDISYWPVLEKVGEMFGE
jgi:hypothetical protein